MCEKTVEQQDLRIGGVYFLPELPRQAYSIDDWEMLQARQCSFDHAVGGRALTRYEVLIHFSVIQCYG